MFGPLSWFTVLHTLLSLVAIALGVLPLVGVGKGRRRSGVGTVFLVAAFFASTTGFVFPFHGATPAIAVGIVVLLVLAWTAVARRSAGAVQSPAGHGDQRVPAGVCACSSVVRQAAGAGRAAAQCAEAAVRHGAVGCTCAVCRGGLSARQAVPWLPARVTGRRLRSQRIHSVWMVLVRQFRDADDRVSLLHPKWRLCHE